jgi:hypothetical protein
MTESVPTLRVETRSFRTAGDVAKLPQEASI